MVSRINCKGGLSAFLLFCLCLTMLLVPLQSTIQAQGQTQHVVQTGDTLYAIALQYSTTVSALRSLNGLEVNDFLRVGQVLQIPGSGGSDSGTPEAGSSGTGCAAQHTVEAGDALLAISVRYDVAADAIARANSLSDVNHLFIGQVLCIPSEDAVPSPTPTPTATPLSLIHI